MTQNTLQSHIQSLMYRIHTKRVALYFATHYDTENVSALEDAVAQLERRLADLQRQHAEQFGAEYAIEVV